MAGALRRLGVRSHVLKSLGLMVDAHTLVSITDTQRRIVYVNDKSCEISGYTRAELIGQTHDIFRSGFHPDSFYEEIWSTISSGKVWTGDMQIRAKDGSLYWLLSTISPIYDEQNRVVGYGSVKTDVTAQRLKMAEMEDSEQKAHTTLKSAIDVLDSGISIYDAETRLIIANKRSKEMYPEAQDLLVPGQAATSILARILPNLSPEELRRVVDAHMSTSENLAYRELSDGRYVRITRARTPEGGMVSVHTDISDLIQQKKLLEEQAATMDLMTAVAVDANESADAESAYSACLKRICTFADWQVGHTYLVDENDSRVCHSGTSWYFTDEDRFAPFRDASNGIRYEAGIGVPGMVLETGQPAWVSDCRARPDFPRARHAEQCGIIGGAAFPVRVRNEIVAVLEFYATRPLEPSPRLSEILSHVCTQVGRVAERERSEKKLMTQVAAELRKRDKELFDKNAHFDAVLKKMSQGICMFDKDQRLIVSNRRYAEIYGLPPEILRPGITLREILQHRIDQGLYSGESPEEYIEERMAWVTSGVRSSKVQHLSDGRSIAITHQPMDDGGWLTSHEDITARVESEKALRESQELLSKAFRASPAAMAISALEDGSHIEVNDTWSTMTGYTREDAMAHSALELGLWADPTDRQRFVSMLNENGSVQNFETKFRTKDGRELDAIVAGERVDLGGMPRLLITWHDISARVRSERALKESQQLFSKAFRASPVAMAISTPEDGTRLDVNETWAGMLGYTREQALASTAERQQTWAFPDERQKFVDQIRRDGSVRGFDAKLRTKDGNVLDLILFGEKVEIDGVERMLIVAYDVTERKKAEEALRESEKRFKSLVESTNVVPWEFDPETMRFTYVGPQAVAMFGYPVEDWYAQGFWQKTIHPDDREKTVRTCIEATRQCKDHEFEYRLETADGGYLWVRDVVSVVAENNEAKGLRGILINISERKRAREALEQSEQRFKDIVEISSDWIWECDENLRFTYLSERFTEVTGVDREQLYGKTRYEVSGGAVADWDSHYADLEASRPFREFKYSVRTKSGRRHWSISGRPVFDTNGNFRGYRGTGYDRTSEVEAEAELIRHRDHLQELVNEATGELKQRAEELKQALAKEKELNELQRQFVSMASHEFRTPLAIIDSAAQRLIRNAAKIEADDVRRRVEKIRSAVGRMTQLMESTLVAAKLESGTPNIAIEPCDISALVRETCDAQQDIASRHKIALEIGDIPQTIKADAAAIGQIVTNLLSNAIKYAPDAPDIEVKAVRDGDFVALSFRDFGVGIDEDEIPKMFQRFFRARTSAGIAGTGIGLNLVKTLVELHGGSIKVESKLGEGSLFTVRLPIEGPQSLEKAQGEAA